MKNKHTNKLLAMIISCMTLNAMAGDVSHLTVTGSESIVDSTVGYASEYVWRGAHVGDAVTSASVGTAFELPTDITLGINTWYNMTDTDNDEFIGSVAVSKSVADYLVSLSYIWYSVDFDRTSGESQELGLTVSRSVGSVDLALTQYLALEGDNNSYSELAAKYSTDFNALPFAVDFYGEVGYVAEHGKLTHALAKVSTDIPVFEEVVASPFVAASVSLSEASGVRSSSNYLFAGLEFKRSF